MESYKKTTGKHSKACIIWMHGLGADAEDMSSLAEQLALNLPVTHVFINAPVRPVTINNYMPMRAWYDIYGIKLNEREDHEGIQSSEEEICSVIKEQLSEFKSQEIFLAGFSQGGAMALYTGLRHTIPLGGIIALSSYLPLANYIAIAADKNLPIFLASGIFDPIVLPAWTELTIEYLKAKGLNNIETHQYSMEHSVCAEEMQDLAKWLQKQILAKGEVE